MDQYYPINAKCMAIQLSDKNKRKVLKSIDHLELDDVGRLYIKQEKNSKVNIIDEEKNKVFMKDGDWLVIYGIYEDYNIFSKEEFKRYFRKVK